MEERAHQEQAKKQNTGATSSTQQITLRASFEHTEGYGSKYY